MLLMYKDTPVADLLMRRGSIWSVNQIYKDSLIPIGLFPDQYTFGKDEEHDGDLFDRWWKNNAIPTERDSVRKSLECVGVDRPEELKFLSHGLSLLNHYWIKEKDENITWKDINFWENPFSDEIGVALFNHKALHSPISAVPSPDAGLNGALKKCWVKIESDLNDYDATDGKHYYQYYIKKTGTGSYGQEVYNEVLASNLYDAIGCAHADYKLYNEDGDIFCLSRCYMSDDYDFIPMYQLWNSVPVSYIRKDNFFPSDYEKALKICEYYKIPDASKHLNDILCMDYILSGSDRHLNNFGFMQDTEGKLTFSPIYDSGSCLWYDTPFTRNVNGLDDSFQMAKPFGGNPASGTWEKQRRYINDYIPLSKETLISELEKYYRSLIDLAKMPEQRVLEITDNCIKRAFQLQKYLESRQDIDCGFLDERYIISESDKNYFSSASIKQQAFHVYSDEDIVNSHNDIDYD